MNHRIAYIRFFSHISNHFIAGATLLFFIFVYNSVAKCSFALRSRIEPSVVGTGSHIHTSVKICAWGVTIPSFVTIAEKSVIKPRTIIGEQVSIGTYCVIGNAGFQVLRYQDRRLPIVHTGRVIIGDHVIIGDRTCIDRALFGGITSVGSFSHIGSHSIVGHNIRIGSHCRLGNFVAIGGKSRIGDRVIIGDRVSIANRITIESGSVIPSGSVITRDVRNEEG